MVQLTEDQMQDFSAFVYQFVIQYLTPSLEQEGNLGAGEKELIKMMASVSSVAVAAAYTYLRQIEAGEHSSSPQKEN